MYFLCVRSLNSKKIMFYRFLLNQIKNEKYQQHKYQMLERMRKFLSTNSCRRTLLLNHFLDEENKNSSPEAKLVPTANCCDNCTNNLKSGFDDNQSEQKDYTDEAIKLLSCVKLFNERFGLTTYALFLIGSVSVSRWIKKNNS